MQEVQFQMSHKQVAAVPPDPTSRS